MSGAAEEPGPPRPAEQPYGMDDLVRHEKRQIWFTAVLLIGAVVVTVGRQWTRGEAPPAEPAPAAVPSARAVPLVRPLTRPEQAPLGSGATTGSSAR